MNKEVNPVFAWFIIVVVVAIAFFFVERQITVLNKDIDAISSTQANIIHKTQPEIGTGVSTTTLPVIK